MNHLHPNPHLNSAGELAQDIQGDGASLGCKEEMGGGFRQTGSLSDMAGTHDLAAEEAFSITRSG